MWKAPTMDDMSVLTVLGVIDGVNEMGDVGRNRGRKCLYSMNSSKLNGTFTVLVDGHGSINLPNNKVVTINLSSFSSRRHQKNLVPAVAVISFALPYLHC